MPTNAKQTTDWQAEAERLRSVLRRISVTVQVAAEEDDFYTTPKQSRDSLCKALSREIREALAHGR